ncbi:phosphate ABC transporter membrane protein 2, PhoT family [Desulfatibacillum alkenivorans DSM 16219]|jgi:phosphate transport system permease protein|uniref:Phosphate ABC transporter membrane protein 2, PhoT family n=1 Tax=Desulfatibacillum alkenivorans DSM 16219 TaxID=1121393 RepID=A0A1M6PEB8_9BACT|nr:ABC transporter permease subunit [Desulfatibacillum alkenivorans]SHK06240.1 phosphate ABC transporter membrane protein 2, PhoT family [Desulfatibacillum alkenivorans DSM 16219]
MSEKALKWTDRAVVVFAWSSAIILICALFLLIGSLLKNGWQTLGLDLIFGNAPPLDAILLKRRVFGGLFPAIAGTLLLVVLSVSLAVPIGVCAGVYMSEYASAGLRRILGLCFDILAGVPSIVVGLFGFSGAIILHRIFDGFRPCLAVSAASLAILVLPYLVRTTQTSMQGISPGLRITALALGASKMQNIVYVLLPRSMSGILSGIVLAIGRCAEDTAVIMLTGVVATAGVPGSLFGQYEALPFYIYYISSQYTDQAELMTGYGASIILLCVCLALFLIALGVRKGLSHQVFYRI